jgi:PAS domain S-box-containing protein
MKPVNVFLAGFHRVGEGIDEANMSNASTLHYRIGILRWALPCITGMLAVIYETSLGRWIHDAIGPNAYFNVDIAFYGTVVPLLIFMVLTLIRRWLEMAQRAAQQAQVSERRLGSIMSASAYAILSLDSAGNIESWNRGAELLFGYSAHDMRGRPLSQLLGGGEGAGVEYRWLREALQQADFVRGHETVCRDTNGHEVDVELTSTRLADATGRFLGMSVVLRDITERKRRDEEIRQLNASLSEQVAIRTRELDEKVAQLARANAGLRALDQMRNEFMSVVSHQIRAPLTNMRGATERMQTDCTVVNATCSRMFTILEQQVVRLDHLVRDVLSTASIESGALVLQSEPISVLPVVQQTVEQMRARGSGRPIQSPNKPGLPLALADHDRVMEILTNLLDNADKYSPAGEEITIDAQANETEITLSVRDHGRGLPASDMERLFDKYYRADNSDSQAAYGYGLGLYVCRRLVEAHGGRIWAENASGGGAMFSFTLPVAP